jgi:hypothetical protein
MRLQRTGEDCAVRSFMICTAKQILFRRTTEEEREWRGMCHEWREERCTQGFGGEPEGKNHLHDLGIDGRIILKWIFNK